jgi:hypothetical protein
MSAHASIPPSRPSRAPEPGAVLVLRFGTALGLAAAAAVGCALPAALRVSDAAGNLPMFRAWIAIAAAALGPMLVAVVVLRAARDGLRAFSGPGAEARLFAGALWLAAVTVGLAFLGSELRATTHHHGLAGVTFAFLALAWALATAAACARIETILQSGPRGMRRALATILGLGALLALSWTTARFSRATSAGQGPSAAAATVVDLLSFTLAALLTTHRSNLARRWLALVGPPVAVLVAAMGLATLRDPRLCDAIEATAPAFAPAISALRLR